MMKSVLAACVVVACVSAVACSGSPPDLLPIPPQTVAVRETLRIPLAVNNPSGSPLTFRFEVGSSLTGLESSATITGTPSGGEFRWSPLASHVGTHEFTFIVSSDDGEDRESAIITVMPNADAAPIFMRPGAGATYDLTRDPCVAFDIEVRDDDSEDVTIEPRSALPEGAELSSSGTKEASFHWCPEPDQVETAERWTIQLAADDGEHDPTPHDYIAVLRSGPKDGCPGAPPTVTIGSPTEASRVTSSTGYPVSVTVNDDMALRDAPLLYYTTTAPEDPDKPDVTAFEQTTFVEDASAWTATIPDMGLAEGQERTVYVVVSATDNDDPMGSTCDHRTDSALLTFVAIGGAAGGGTLARCDLCTRSDDCASGACIIAAGGARCLDTCDGTCSNGTCRTMTRREGSTTMVCGGVAEVCEGDTAMCVDDAREENDALSSPATTPDTLTGMQVCQDDPDYYRVTVSSAGTRFDVTVDGFVHEEGDLDMQLLASSGTVLASSAGTTDSEHATYCAGTTGSFIVKVYGYDGAENDYNMHITRTAGACCVDDSREPDDSRTSPRVVTPTVGSPFNFDGTICPRDDDYLGFDVTGASHIRAEILLDHSMGDLDMELYSPTGAILDASEGTSDTEIVEADVPGGGRYVVRVLGYSGAAGEYAGELTVSGAGGCTSSLTCPSGTVCNAGRCVAAACTSAATCPSGYGCPTAGPGTGVTSDCGSPCSLNADCRTDEACKWQIEGRFCGRRGAGLNGAACATFRDCGGQRACLPWTGGYCARASCTSSSSCESGTYCVNVGGINACVLGCASSPDVCRAGAGYSCRARTDSGGTSQLVCVPG